MNISRKLIYRTLSLMSASGKFAGSYYLIMITTANNRIQLSIPLLDKKYAIYPVESLVKSSQEFYFEGKHRSALTDLRDIGKFFPKILLDEQTINRYVFCHSEEKSQEELFGIVESVTGKKVPRTMVCSLTNHHFA